MKRTKNYKGMRVFMRRTMAVLLAIALLLFFATGCEISDSTSSDDGVTMQSTTTTVTSSIDGDIGTTTLNGDGERTDTITQQTTSATRWTGKTCGLTHYTTTTTTTQRLTTTATTGSELPSRTTTTTVRATQTTVPTQPLITHSLGKATLPLTGFCGLSDDNKIMIQTDYVGYASGELTPPQAAFAYRDGEIIQLKPFDFTLMVEHEFSSYSKAVAVPVRYFVMDSTVYAYAMAWPDGSARFISIPNDSQHVLLTGSVVKRPVKVNVVTGKCEFLTKEYVHYRLCDTLLSSDGQYITMLAGHPILIQMYSNTCLYVYHFKSRKLTKLPEEDGVSLSPWYYIEDSLFLWRCSCTDGGPCRGSSCGWYAFNVLTGELEPRHDLAGYSTWYAERRPYWHLLYDTPSGKYTTTGKLAIVNLKTGKHNSIDCGKEINVHGANESGNIVLVSDKNDLDTIATYAFLDMKTGKEIALSEVLPKRVYDKYKDYSIIGINWCGENAVMINFSMEPDSPDQSQCGVEIIELPMDK